MRITPEIASDMFFQCCYELHVCPNKIRSPDRHRVISNRRHQVMWILHRAMGISQPRTARILWRLNSTTVLSAYRKIERSPELLAWAKEIAGKVGGAG